MRPALPGGHQHWRVGEETARPGRGACENRRLAGRKFPHCPQWCTLYPAGCQWRTQVARRPAPESPQRPPQQSQSRPDSAVDGGHAATAEGHFVRPGEQRCAATGGVPGSVRVAGDGPGGGRPRTDLVARQNPRPAGKSRLSSGVPGKPGQPVLRPALCFQGLRRTGRTQAPGADQRAAACQPWRA
ncbi:hypothetical protein D3C80_1459110 [compost metagenome]